MNKHLWEEVSITWPEQISRRGCSSHATPREFWGWQLLRMILRSGTQGCLWPCHCCIWKPWTLEWTASIHRRLLRCATGKMHTTGIVLTPLFRCGWFCTAWVPASKSRQGTFSPRCHGEKQEEMCRRCCRIWWKRHRRETATRSWSKMQKAAGRWTTGSCKMKIAPCWPTGWHTNDHELKIGYKCVNCTRL